MINRTDLQALRNMIEEARLILATTALPQGRAERALELLEASSKLVNEMLSAPTAAAAALGKKGGAVTAKRGSEYFKQIAAMRKTKAGGRPKSDDGR